MANSVSLRQLPIEKRGMDIYAATVVLDTTGADLLVADISDLMGSASINARWGIFGISYNELDAHTLQIKSGSTVIDTIDRAANDNPLILPADFCTPLWVGNANEDLNLRVATAGIAMMQLTVGLFEKLYLK